MRVKTEAKRDAIVAAASEVFRDDGYEGASMAGIAARVGGSKATLYSYFKSKEELFVAVTHEAAKAQFDPVFAALGQAGDDLPATLQVFGEKVLGFLCSEDAIKTRRAVVAESGRTDIGRRFHEVGPKAGMERIAAFLQDQMDRGRMKPAAPLLAALQLVALLECETLTPLLLGLEKGMSPARIRSAVKRALGTFLAAYAVAPAPASPPLRRRRAAS